VYKYNVVDLLLGVFWWFCIAGSAHSVHGPSLWPEDVTESDTNPQ